MMLKQSYTIYDLPPEVLVFIFRNLNYNQLLQVRLVCSRFWAILNNFPIIWGLPGNCNVQDYLRGSALIKKLDRDMPVLDADNFNLLVEQLRSTPITTSLGNESDLNHKLKRLKQTFIVKDILQKLYSKKYIILNLLRFVLAGFLFALVFGYFNKILWSFGFVKNNFSEDVDCTLSSNAKDFVAQVLKHANYMYMSKFVIGFTGGYFGHLLDWKELAPRLSGEFYSYSLPETYQRPKQTCMSASVGLTLKLLNYRDLISFVLAIALLVSLIRNDFFNLAEHYCFKDLQKTFNECFDQCYQKTERRHYFFSSNTDNFATASFLGLLFGYSLLSVCMRALQYAMKKFDKESNYRLPVYQI